MSATPATATATVMCTNPVHEHYPTVGHDGCHLDQARFVSCIHDGEPAHFDLYLTQWRHDNRDAPRCRIYITDDAGSPCCPPPYAEVAAELHRMADALAGITTDLPPMNVHMSLSVPYQLRDGGEAEAVKVALVDAAGMALVGRSGKVGQSGSGWYYQADSDKGAVVRVWVYGPAKDPTLADKDAELERLRAELAAVRTELAGVYHPAVRKQGRTFDDATTPEVCDVDHENPIDD